MWNAVWAADLARRHAWQLAHRRTRWTVPQIVQQVHLGPEEKSGMRKLVPHPGDWRWDPQARTWARWDVSRNLWTLDTAPSVLPTSTPEVVLRYTNRSERENAADASAASASSSSGSSAPVRSPLSSPLPSASRSWSTAMEPITLIVTTAGSSAPRRLPAWEIPAGYVGWIRREWTNETRYHPHDTEEGHVPMYTWKLRPLNRRKPYKLKDIQSYRANVRNTTAWEQRHLADHSASDPWRIVLAPGDYPLTQRPRNGHPTEADQIRAYYAHKKGLEASPLSAAEFQLVNDRFERPVVVADTDTLVAAYTDIEAGRSPPGRVLYRVTWRRPLLVADLSTKESLMFFQHYLRAATTGKTASLDPLLLEARALLSIFLGDSSTPIERQPRPPGAAQWIVDWKRPAFFEREPDQRAAGASHAAIPNHPAEEQWPSGPRPYEWQPLHHFRGGLLLNARLAPTDQTEKKEGNLLLRLATDLQYWKAQFFPELPLDGLVIPGSSTIEGERAAPQLLLFRPKTLLVADGRDEVTTSTIPTTTVAEPLSSEPSPPRPLQRRLATAVQPRPAPPLHVHSQAHSNARGYAREMGQAQAQALMMKQPLGDGDGTDLSFSVLPEELVGSPISPSRVEPLPRDFSRPPDRSRSRLRFDPAEHGPEWVNQHAEHRERSEANLGMAQGEPVSAIGPQDAVPSGTLTLASPAMGLLTPSSLAEPAELDLGPSALMFPPPTSGGRTELEPSRFEQDLPDASSGLRNRSFWT